MEIILGFSPWVVYWALTIRQPIVLAGAVSLALALIVNLRSFRKRRPKTLEMGAFVFLAAATIAALFVRSAIFVDWWRVSENTALLVTILISIAMKKPLVFQYAQEEIPNEKRDSPHLYDICLKATWFWAAVILVMMLSGIAAAVYRLPMTWKISAAHAVGFTGAMTVTRLYRKRAARESG